MATLKLCRQRTVPTEVVSALQCEWGVSGERVFLLDSLGRLQLRDVSTNVSVWFVMQSVRTPWLCFAQVPSEPHRIVWLFKEGPHCLRLWTARIASKSEWSMNFPVCSLEECSRVLNASAILDLAGLSAVESDPRPTAMSIARRDGRKDCAVIALSSGLVCLCRLIGKDKGVMCAWNCLDYATHLRMVDDLILVADSGQRCWVWKVEDEHQTGEVKVGVQSKHECHAETTCVMMSKECDWMWIGHSDGSLTVHSIGDWSVLTRIPMKESSAIVSLSLLSEHSALVAIGQACGTITLLDCSMMDDCVVVSRQRQDASGAVIQASYQPSHRHFFLVVRAQQSRMQLWTAPLSKEGRTQCSSLLIWPDSCDASSPLSHSTRLISNGKTVDSYRPGLLSAAVSAQTTAVSNRRFKADSREEREQRARQALRRSGDLSQMIQFDHSEKKYDYSKLTKVSETDSQWERLKRRKESGQSRMNNGPSKKKEAEMEEVKSLIQRNSEESQHRCDRPAHFPGPMAGARHCSARMSRDCRLRERMFRV